MKILFRRVDEQGLWDGIWQAYEGDEEMTRIHILKGAPLEEMVRYTWDQSRVDVERVGQKFYQLLLPDKTLIGYTTLLHAQPIPMLYTFGINIRYRKREILTGWLKGLDKHLGYKYTLTVRDTNARAVGFFTRNGFGVKEDPANKQFILWRQR